MADVNIRLSQEILCLTGSFWWQFKTNKFLLPSPGNWFNHSLSERADNGGFLRPWVAADLQGKPIVLGNAGMLRTTWKWKLTWYVCCHLVFQSLPLPWCYWRLVKCLAKGHKCQDWNSNPHSAEQKTKACVQCAWPLELDTPLKGPAVL